jgi:hypothetical protein
MRQSIEFHDSVLDRAEMSGGVLVLHFSSAYIHRSTGDPGVSPGDGLVQPATLSFGSATCVGDLKKMSGPLSGGHLSISGKLHSLVPLPLSQNGEIRAELLLISGLTLSVTASSVHSQLLGTPLWVERYAG